MDFLPCWFISKSTIHFSSHPPFRRSSNSPRTSGNPPKFNFVPLKSLAESFARFRKELDKSAETQKKPSQVPKTPEKTPKKQKSHTHEVSVKKSGIAFPLNQPKSAGNSKKSQRDLADTMECSFKKESGSVFTEISLDLSIIEPISQKNNSFSRMILEKSEEMESSQVPNEPITPSRNRKSIRSDKIEGRNIRTSILKRANRLY